MNYNLVLQLADQLSNSPLEEERICELQPIEGLMDYYQQPFLGFNDPQNQKEHLECLHRPNWKLVVVANGCKSHLFMCFFVPI